MALNAGGLSDFSNNITLVKKYESILHDVEVGNNDYIFKENPIKQDMSIEQFTGEKENSMYGIKIEYETIDVMTDLNMDFCGEAMSSQQVFSSQTNEPVNPKKRKYTKRFSELINIESIGTTKPKRAVKPVNNNLYYELKDYKSESFLRKHLVEMHGGDEFPWRCISCKDLFVTQVEMLAHLSINVHCNADQKLFVCHQCRDMKGSNKGLYYCDICLKSFQSSASLTLHWNRHKEKKLPHVCSFCQKSFEKYKYLIQHRSEEHRNEKQTCQICRTATANLADHIKLTHFGKSFSCSFCPKKFVRKNAMRRHERIQHTGEIKVYCNICGWGAQDYNIMKKHKLEHDKHLDENGQYLPLPSPTAYFSRPTKFFTEACCGPKEPGTCNNCEDYLRHQKSNVLVNSKFTDTRDLHYFIAANQHTDLMDFKSL